jgi:hypothetical protein
MNRIGIATTLRINVVLGALLVWASTLGQAQESLARRQHYLGQLRRLLPSVPAWERWLDSTGELPPDFAAMPSRADLPDPLSEVTTPAQWPARRAGILAAFRLWVLGQIPPAPDNLIATVVSERTGPSALVRQVTLSFGPGRAARLKVPPPEFRWVRAPFRCF